MAAHPDQSPSSRKSTRTLDRRAEVLVSAWRHLPPTRGNANTGVRRRFSRDAFRWWIRTAMLAAAPSEESTEKPLNIRASRPCFLFYRPFYSHPEGTEHKETNPFFVCRLALAEQRWHARFTTPGPTYNETFLSFVFVLGLFRARL